ncbi:MAG TPA: acyltransferase family protein [Candidatus Limnocylindrales bacterium]|nr:acyltransferase family protein [Candidatus Limnocylindrales bacterium]
MGATTPPRRFAGLDGLRAIAVAAVLVYHAEPGLLPGGFLGVDLFFVLSGFLITFLLLDAAAVTGRVDLRAFWARRARRLVPALLLVLAGTVAATVALAPGELDALRRDVLAALAGVTNWELLAGGESYFAAATRPSLLRHLWSLGVEAQFYLLWPIVLAVAIALGRLWLALGVAALGAVGSAVAMAVLLDPGGDPSRVYFGTDTHATGLLTGAVLAIVSSVLPVPDLEGRRRRLAGAAATLAGTAALAAVAASFVLADAYEPILYQGGLVAFVLAAAVVVGVLPAAGPMARLLDVAPLRWLGERSYGIYLWHWPVYQLSRPGIDVNADAPFVHVARVAVTLLLAELSWSLVEQPIRSRGWRTRRPHTAPASAVPSPIRALPARAPAGLLGVAGLWMTGVLAWSALVPAVPAAAHGDPSLTLPTAVRDPAPPAPVTPRPVVDSPDDEVRPDASWGWAGLAGADPVASPSPQPSPDAAPSASAPPVVAAAQPRVFAVGDSVMLSALDQLRRRVKGLQVDAEIGRFFTDAPAIVDRQRTAGGLGDVVVIHLGNNGPFYRRHFDAVMARLRDVPLVVFVNLKLPRDWEAHNNKLLEQAVRHHPNAILVDWHAVAAEHPEVFWQDGYHVRAEGGRLYAELLRDAITAGATHDLAGEVYPAP